MLTHFLLFEVARLRHQEMLQQAEVERLYKSVKGNRPGVLRQIGYRLMDAIWQLKAHSQSNPAMPIFGEK